MGLFKPAWMSQNEQKALASLAAISEERVLVRVVASEKALQRVRYEALGRITEQRLLGEAAAHVYSETELIRTLERIDRMDVLAALEKAVIDASPEVNQIKEKSIRFNYPISDKRVHAVWNRQRALRRAAEEKERRETLAALDTDEKRIACIRAHGGELAQYDLCLAALEDVREDGVLAVLEDSLDGLTGGLARAIIRRRYPGSKQAYLLGYGRFMDASQIRNAALSLTPVELAGLTLDIKRLKELEDCPFLRQAVAEQGSAGLAEELIGHMRENAGGDYSRFSEARWAAGWLQVLYRAGKWTDKIGACRGNKIKDHRDAPPVCSFYHEDFPGEVFEL